MVFAEQDSVVDRGAAAVLPVLNVMRFAPGGGPFAAVEAASAISFGEGDALPLGEEPLFDADVDDAVVFVEQDRHDAGLADLPFHGRDADRGGLPVERARPGSPIEVGQRDAHDDLGATHGEDHAGVGGGTDADEFDERVEPRSGRPCGGRLRVFRLAPGLPRRRTAVHPVGARSRRRRRLSRSRRIPDQATHSRPSCHRCAA